MRKSLKQYIEDLDNSNQFSGTVLVAKEGKVIYKDAIGIANYDFDIKNSLDTKFCIASITKSITATAIMKLVEEGLVKLNDPINQYQIDHPYGEQITIHHLLTHTSGLAPLYNDPNYQEFIGKPHSLKELVNEFKTRPLKNRPGETFDYSNMGYNILALIIETLTKVSYEEYIVNTILEPLGMKDTGCYHHDHIIKKIANGYSNVNGTFKNSNMRNFHGFMGAGNLYSTVDDLYQYTNALMNTQLLNLKHNQKLIKEYGHVHTHFYYGYGKMMSLKDHEIEYLYQDGGLPGFKSIYVIYPKKELIIIMLSNYDYIKTPEIVRDIERIVLNEEPIFEID